MVRVAYAGSRGSDLAIGREVNPAIYAAGATTATTNQRRPLFPNFGAITMIEPTGRSTYHSLQLSVDKRFSEGLHAARELHALEEHGPLVGEQADRRRRRPTRSTSSSTGARPTSTAVIGFVTSWLWEIPGKPSNRGARRDPRRLGAVGHLDLAERAAVHGHQRRRQRAHGHRRPACRSGRRSGPVRRPRPRRAGARVVRHRRPSPPTRSARSATSGATPCAGRATRHVDLGLQKTFPITPSVRLQFRAEAFNVFNRVNSEQPERRSVVGELRTHPDRAGSAHPAVRVARFVLG